MTSSSSAHDGCTHGPDCEHASINMIMQYVACTEELRECFAAVRKMRDECSTDEPASVPVFLSYVHDALATALMCAESQDAARAAQERAEQARLN